MLAIILGDLFHQLFDVVFVYLHKLLAPSAEVVYVTGVYVEPEGVYVQIVRFQALPQETVAGYVLQLLQGIDLHTHIANV